jgi:hypothetical protein
VWTLMSMAVVMSLELFLLNCFLREKRDHNIPLGIISSLHWHYVWTRPMSSTKLFMLCWCRWLGSTKIQHMQRSSSRYVQICLLPCHSDCFFISKKHMNMGF